MKKILPLLILLFFQFCCSAQIGIISTIAGGDSSGFSGDGGQASAAALLDPYEIAIDSVGNIYFADGGNFRIRKIDLSGIITTIAGNGSYTSSGDGGPATAAGFYWPYSIGLDHFGNIYVGEYYGNRIRKINSSGIISTFAGNGTGGYSGDGGAATDATIEAVTSIAVDIFGGVYFANGNTVRKVDTLGIIRAVAGTGTTGYSGDGGPATSAMLGETVEDICFDKLGNLYLADITNRRIRKIDTTGIITTLAGSGTYGYSGDGGPATAAEIDPYGVDVDIFGNVYICDISSIGTRIRKVNINGIISTIAGNGIAGYGGDGGPATAAELSVPSFARTDNKGRLVFSDNNNNRIRKIETKPIVSDSFLIYVATFCGGLQISDVVHSYSSGQHLVTYLSNGYEIDTATFRYGENGVVQFSVPISISGVYSIKQVLYNATTPIDSIIFFEQYISCQNINLNFYFDANGNCLKDTNEYATSLPIIATVDSNGIRVDTISCTSGLYYNAYGNYRDVYCFHFISVPAGLDITCPSSGIFADTLSLDNGASNNIGFSCTSDSGSFDLGEYYSSIAGRHKQSIDLVANNTYCTPESTTLTMNFSPDYIYESAYPSPASVIGHTITWDLGDISSNMAVQQHIHATLTVPGTWLTPGDTVHSECVILPTTGDIDTNNNVVVKVDTVTGSWDPNEMSVSPNGFILPGAQLQYTINFENTGNDTAFNIYVMDTLSDNVDPHSMRIVAASAVMNTLRYYDTTIHHNVLKFEFPNINLLDSSHHDQCTGMVIFNIMPKSGLAEGATVFNHAGIFFDFNDVVMTDTIENIISLIHGAASVCQSANDTLSELAPGGTWRASNSHASISASGIVFGVSSGRDTITYYINYANGNIPTQKIINIISLPYRGTIVGVDSICVGSSTTVADSVIGGYWSSSNGTATISSSGSATAISSGIDTLIYHVSNSCGIDSAIKMLLIKTLPIVGGISGPDSICITSSAILVDTIHGGTWSRINSHAAINDSGNIVALSTGIDTFFYKVTNFCGSDSAIKTVAISTIPSVGVISGGDSVCVGSAITLSDSVSTGIWRASNGHSTIAGDIVTGITAGLDTIFYTTSNRCGSDTSIHVITIHPLPYAGTISGIDSFCTGSFTTLTETISGGMWSVTNSIATVYSGIVSGVVKGIDTVEYSVTNTCGTDLAKYQVKVDSAPLTPTIFGNNVVCIGRHPDTLNGIPAGGGWSHTNTNASVTGGIVLGVMTGADTIIYVISNFCGNNYNTYVVNILPASECDSISSVKILPISERINVFPNPATDELTITGITQTTSYKLLTISSVYLRQGILREENNIVSIHNFAPGVYILELIGIDGSKSILKIIKE